MMLSVNTNEPDKFLETVRRRMLALQEQRVLENLDNRPFAIIVDGRVFDPAGLEELEKQQWVEMLRQTFQGFHAANRLTDFVQDFAKLDEAARRRLVDENSTLFRPFRTKWLKALNDEECQHLASAERWEVFDHLTSLQPIFGVRDEVGGDDVNDAPSPAPAFGRAA